MIIKHEKFRTYGKRNNLSCRDNLCYHLALAIHCETKVRVKFKRRCNSPQDSTAFKPLIFPRHILSIKYIVNLILVILIELTQIFHTMIKRLVHKARGPWWCDQELKWPPCCLYWFYCSWPLSALLRTTSNQTPR